MIYLQNRIAELTQIVIEQQEAQKKEMKKLIQEKLTKEHNANKTDTD